MMTSLTGPVFLLLLLLLSPVCLAESGDSDDEDRPGESRTTIACEGGLLILDCPVSHVIRIERANYGRFSLRLCNPRGEFVSVGCQSATAAETVSTRCDGHNKCEFLVNSQIFDDPCPGTSKYAQVEYHCEAVGILRTSTSNPLPHLPQPDGPYFPNLPSVPVPEEVKVCLHPMSQGSLYDLYWQLPETSLIIQHFVLKYRVNEETYEKNIDAIKVEDYSYMYAFEPDQNQRSFAHEFAIKALTFQYGGGDFSPFVSAEHCSLDGEGGIVTYRPVAISTPSVRPNVSEVHTCRSSEFACNDGHCIQAVHVCDQEIDCHDGSDEHDCPEPECREDQFRCHSGECVSVQWRCDSRNHCSDGSDEAGCPTDGGGLRLMCRGVRKLGVYWSDTPPSHVRVAACPRTLEGQMRFKCLSNGMWDPSGPETGECREIVRPATTTTTTSTTTTTTTTSTTTTTTTTTVPTTTTTAKPIRFNNKVNAVLERLAGRAERYNVSSILPRLARNISMEIRSIADQQRKKGRAQKFKDEMLTLGDELMNDGDAWLNMSIKEQRSTASALLDSMEDIGLVAASTLDLGTSNTTRKANVVMKLMNVDTGRGQAAVLGSISPVGTSSKMNQFTIPSRVLQSVTASNSGSVPVAFVIMNNLSEWLTPKTVNGSLDKSTNHTNTESHQQEPIRRIVNSDIVSATVSQQRLTNLAEPVIFMMEHRQVESVENPKCSFWDTEQGVWSTEGCWVSESNKTHTICKCNHLTSFAVLMDIAGATQLISAQARFSLELMTYIGCTISIICLLLSWVTFVCFKSLDCDRNTIHKHLVFCLMVAQIVLITGLQQTQPPVLCSVIAGVLHYFFLASFAWMCLEGVQLYVMLIEVFESERSRVLYYYLFGYGVPAIIVAVAAGVYSGGYGTATHCWLTVERGFIWSFVGPALAVLVMNMVMLGIAISIMVRHSSVSHTMQQKSIPQKMRTWVKGAVVLVVLLGLTWVFGILYLDNVYHTLIFSYIFTLLNTLQGLFIFIFHCLLNEKVQKEYRRMIRRCQWMPDCLRVRYGGGSSSGSRENSSSGNVVSRFFRNKKRHGDHADSSNNSARPFLRKDQRYFSSSAPSSSDGATSSRLSSETSNNNNRKTSNVSTFRSSGSDVRFFKTPEFCGIAGELSEVPDCSVVDSEFVSEYCQQNLQISAEPKRYSSASEDSGKGEGLEEEDREEEMEQSLDRLAALSVESLSKRQSDCISSSDFGEGDNGEGVTRNDAAENPLPNRDPVMNRLQDPVKLNHDEEDEEEEAVEESEQTSPESQPLMLKQTDSEQVLINNAVNKPREIGQGSAGSPKQSPSLTHISIPIQENGVEPFYTSVPCLTFKPASKGPVASTKESDSVIVNSLPDLNHYHSNGTAVLMDQYVPRQSPKVKRHSSDGHVSFSNFRSSGSEC